MVEQARRTPRWVRGLKYDDTRTDLAEALGSHPTMGAWIEILVHCLLLHS